MFIDGIPVNMPSHAHGQGFADLHWLIPEALQQIDVVKGPYDVRSGDFSTAGAVNLITRKDFPVPPDPFGIAIADVNGDKHLDIVIGHYSGQGTDPSKNAMSVLLGDGKGNFTLAKGSPFSTGHYPGTVAAGDLNGDGIADIVVPNYEDGTLTVYLGGRNGIALASYSPIRVGHTPHGAARKLTGAASGGSISGSAVTSPSSWRPTARSHWSSWA